MIKSKIKKILLLAFIIFLAIFIYKDTILQLFNIHKTNKNITVDISELENSDNPQKLLQVHFIDVGQGDATLVTIEGHAMLVDGGDYTKGTTVQKYLQTQGDRKSVV